jgi:chaperonin cofactor prefoldin
MSFTYEDMNSRVIILENRIGEFETLESPDEDEIRQYIEDKSELDELLHEIDNILEAKEDFTDDEYVYEY